MTASVTSSQRKYKEPCWAWAWYFQTISGCSVWVPRRGRGSVRVGGHARCWEQKRYVIVKVQRYHFHPDHGKNFSALCVHAITNSYSMPDLVLDTVFFSHSQKCSWKLETNCGGKRLFPLWWRFVLPRKVLVPFPWGTMIKKNLGCF